MTKRERLEILVALLTEPTRSSVRRVLDGQQRGQIDLGRDTVRALVRERLVRDQVALLLAFEAVELLSGGAVRVTWGANLDEISFSVEAFPERQGAGVSLALEDDGPASGPRAPRRGKLWIAWGPHKGAPDLQAALKLVAREVARHLGVTIGVRDARP